MHPRHIRLRNFFSSSTLELRHNNRFPLPRRKDMGTPKKKASAVAVMVLVRNDGRVWKLLDSKRVFVFFCENKISTLTIKAVNHGEEVFVVVVYNKILKKNLATFTPSASSSHRQRAENFLLVFEQGFSLPAETTECADSLVWKFRRKSCVLKESSSENSIEQ